MRERERERDRDRDRDRQADRQAETERDIVMYRVSQQNGPAVLCTVLINFLEGELTEKTGIRSVCMA